MPPASIPQLIDTLEQTQLLTSGQVGEVRRAVQNRSPAPESLLQDLVRQGWLTPFQAQQVFQGKAGQLVLGSYLLLEPLGKGGSGQVYKARHIRMQRLVAIKLLRPELVKDADATQRFYREIEVTSRMSHPNLVHAYEAGPMGNALVLVMEYVAGIDLDRMVRDSGALPVSQACDYIRQAAEGLQYAHTQGLIHRDIKPSNLLVAKTQGGPSPGLVKILDLGLARLQQPAANSATKNLTMIGGAGVMMGTPDYMAPEQALDLHSADIRSDIYSLGCTLFFLLTGQPPFPAATLAEKLIKHQQAEPPFDLLPRTVPPDVQTALRKMLAKAGPQRYQTPGEVAAALKPFSTPTETADTLAGLSGTITDKPGIVPDKPRPKTAIRTASGRVPTVAGHKTENKDKRRRAAGWLISPRILIGLAVVTVVALAGVIFVAISGGDGGNQAVAAKTASPKPGAGVAPAAGKASAVTIPAPDPGVGGDGLLGHYFATQDLTGKAITRVDPALDFDWGKGSPMPEIPVDHFSVRWTGHVVPRYTETYTFFTHSDDGVRLWVNNQLIIDNWTYHGLTSNQGKIALTAGQKTPIKIEYFENTGDAVMKMGWFSPSQDRQIVPQGRLLSGAAPAATSPATPPATGKAGANPPPNPLAATAQLTADNAFEFYLNDTLIGKGDNLWKLYEFPVTLKPGENLIAVKGMDYGPPAGLIFRLVAGKTTVLSSPQWKTSLKESPGWNTSGFDDKDWKLASDIAGYGGGVWGKKLKPLPDTTKARWIWAGENPTAPVVYFRHVFPFTDPQPAR